MEIKRKPNWLRIAVSQGSNFTKTFETILSSGVDTVCQNAKCPNRSDCWSRGTATFMILGGAFAPAIGAFCAVGTERPLRPIPTNPTPLQMAVAKLALKCAVITSATRDDIADGGAEHWAKTVLAIRKKSPDTKIEILTPDFCGDKTALETVFKSRPDVFRTMWKPSSVCKNPYAKRPITKLRSACLPPPANTACVSKAP